MYITASFIFHKMDDCMEHACIGIENFSKDTETIASKEREPGTQGVRETSYPLGIVLDCLTLLNAI